MIKQLRILSFITTFSMIFSSSITKCVDPITAAIVSAGTYAAIHTYRYFFPPFADLP